MTRNEAQTRKEIIDKRLKLSGWDVANPMQVTQELDIWVGLPQGVREPQTPYQGHLFVDYALLFQAIRSVLERIEKKHRKFLLVMATGTGKTRTCMGLLDVLMRSNWTQKVLFLVDRIALREQALETFKEHLPNAPIWPKTGEVKFASDRRIY